MYKILGVFVAAAMAVPALAQDLQSQEIIVTGSRIEQGDYSRDMPAVGLRRKADYLVQSVTISGDTRDEKQRVAEIRAMLKKAITQADRSGVELAYGDYILTRLTLQNADELPLVNDRRPDSQKMSFLVKAPLADKSVGDAEERIRTFVRSVPEVGRAQMDENGDSSLSVVGPDKYREAIIELVSADAKQQAHVLGDDYAVELAGLNMPVQWARSGPGEVLLYIPYELKIVPRR